MDAEVAMNLKVGDIVMLYSGFLDIPAGTVGVIYETYKDFDNAALHGVSVITENGSDLGGFSFRDQLMYLEYVRSTEFEYEFKNVVYLLYDFRKGVFKNCF